MEDISRDSSRSVGSLGSGFMYVHNKGVFRLDVVTFEGFAGSSLLDGGAGRGGCGCWEYMGYCC